MRDRKLSEQPLFETLQGEVCPDLDHPEGIIFSCRISSNFSNPDPKSISIISHKN
ncbi:MAG: hypothetical protein GF317_20195 [Candidatus Lokiarchaeota archaeon]|nr:hypothetical protein [Candidatus Lokiarchaeota archaeon]MBD3201804.1 hypothetical protein [Candidatus Lokiarchaeota archaeon]